MEVILKIEKTLPLVSGVGKASGKEWRKLEVVGTTFLEQYPKKVLFALWGDQIDNYAPLLMDNALVTVSFDLESRSFIGKDGVERWSTDVKAYKVEEYVYQAPQFAQQQQQAQPVQQFAQPMVQAQPSAQPQPDDNLPF